MATFTAGDFTATQEEVYQALLVDMWPDNIVDAQDNANTSVLQAVYEHQTADVSVLGDSAKDLTVKAMFLGGDVSAVSDCTESCTITGSEFGSAFVNQELTNCFEATFKVDKQMGRTNKIDFDMAVARGLDLADKKLANKLSEHVVAVLDANAGVNIAGADSMIGTVGPGGETVIANLNSELFIDIEYDASINNLDNVYAIHGRNLWKENRLAVCNSQDPGGNCAASLFGNMKQYWDIKNITESVQPSYVIQHGVVAIAHKSIYPSASNAMRHDDLSMFSIPSGALRFMGVNLDVESQEICEIVNGSRKLFTAVKVILRGQAFVAPTGANEDVTGILKLQKTA